MKLAVFVRDTSNQESARLQGAIRRLSHPRLLGPEEFSVDEVPPDDPADFVLPPTDLKSLAAHHEMFEITARAFALAGQAQRQLVQLFQGEWNRPNIELWKKEVDRLRRPAAPL